jgi:O-antigen/teichoic acid export membrane protein
MKLNLLSIAIGIPVGFLLIPVFGIAGVVISAIVAILAGIVISLFFARRRYGVTVDFGVSSRIFLASVLSALATYGLVSVLNVAMWLQFVSGLFLFLGVYLISTPLVGAIDLLDINNLRAMISGFGVVSKVLHIALAVMEKPLKIRSSAAELQSN